MIGPVRLHLSRSSGFRLQVHSRAVNGLPAVNCARPSQWGNPYQAGSEASGDRAYFVELYRSYLAGREQSTLVAAIGQELRGKNLACWCPLDGRPCHCDVLLEIANGEDIR